MVGYNFQNTGRRTQRESEIELSFDLFTMSAYSAYDTNTDSVPRSHYFDILLIKLNNRVRAWPASIKEFNIRSPKTVSKGQLKQYVS